MTVKRLAAVAAGIVLVAAVAVCQKKKDNPLAPADEAIPVPEGWTLVWHDEFAGSAVDPAKWEFEVNGRGGGNNELQYYTDRPSNAFIENGALVIQARNESYTGPDGALSYTSARLRTKNRGDWTYGRFEIRAKVPAGRGLWPAIWMMPTDNAYGGWAASGEIDIMELLGHEPQKVYGTLHYGGTSPANVHSGTWTVLSSGTFADDFHVFAVEWDTTSIRWLMDDRVYYTRTSDQWYTTNTAAVKPAPFDRRFYLILNVAVGGNWPGRPDGSTVFPQRMTVDWVRVFQREP
jgi:beta-glucanase (GH16 family)